MTEAPVPADLQAAAEDARGKLVELAAESDDAFLEKYLETLELSPEETLHRLAQGNRAGKDLPGHAGECGEEPRRLVPAPDAHLRLAPSPADVPGVPIRKPGADEPVHLPAKPDGPLAALIFKVSSEFTAQEIALLRVIPGTLASGSDVYDSNEAASERIGQLYHFMGKERSDARQAGRGRYRRRGQAEGHRPE